jgi:hypothetical protein
MFWPRTALPYEDVTETARIWIFGYNATFYTGPWPTPDNASDISSFANELLSCIKTAHNATRSLVEPKIGDVRDTSYPPSR